MERGVVTNGLIFPTVAHDSAAVDSTLAAAREALRIVRRAADGHTRTLPPPFGPSSIGFLEAADVADGELRLSGWLLPLGEPPDSVEIVDSQGRTEEAAIGERPDVAQVHPAVAGAARCGWSIRLPCAELVAGATWTVRARRGGRVVFRGRLVGGLRSGRRSMPRELRDGHVFEF
jgi:hypothetical protein